MHLLLRLTVCIFCSMPVNTMPVKYFATGLVTWPLDQSESKGFRNMLLTSDGKHLIISGLNGVYNLNTTDFQLLNQAVKGPLDTDANDVIKIMIYNRTQPENDTFVTTCSSTRDYCDIREVDDISKTVNKLEPPIRIDGVAALMTTSNKPSGRNRREDFLFVGCPHADGQEKLNGRCTKPGVAWYLNSGNDKGSPWYGFKSYEDTPVLTERYIDAFNVDKYKLFFSLQRVKSSNTSWSRLAQVCQYFVGENKYTTPYTYADMPIKCGQMKKMQAVKKIVFGTETMFVAVFSDSSKSAVCVYSMEDIKRKFVENIKDCYRGGRAPAHEDYIELKTSSKPCTIGIADNATFSKPDDYFLCNKDNLAVFHSVIGSSVLSSTPVVSYDKKVTAVTVLDTNSKIVAFLGTNYGESLKAVVHPRISASYITQPRSSYIDTQPRLSFGSKILDLYTSTDKKYIYGLTLFKVFKVPSESCSEFFTCSDCLGTNDPFCGWCVLEERCRTNDTCESTNDWIPASSDEECPNITKITPALMSYREIQKLSIDVSHTLRGGQMYCDFHVDEIGDFDHKVQGILGNDGNTLTCTPVNMCVLEDKIKGSLNVKVTILANDIATTMKGHFTIYKCETFDRCIDCTARNWTCNWCIYSNQCIYNDRNCDENDLPVEAHQCPRVLSYAMLTHYSSLQDLSGTVYLSRDNGHLINITGANLPIPRSTPTDVSYKCKIVVSEAHIVLFNGTSFAEGSLICNISKEGMTTIPGDVGSLKATVQLIWGKIPVLGDTMPVVIYACENLVQPNNNCGQCNSFEIYKPHFHCRWCDTRCTYGEIPCNIKDSDCGDPEITRVYPMSAYMNATTLIDIEGVNLGSVYNDTVNAITIAGIPCTSVENSYDPGKKIVCNLSPNYKALNGNVVVELANNATGIYREPFHFRVSEIDYIVPELGPKSGGTSLSIYGKHLDTGRTKNITIGDKACRLNSTEKENGSYIVCTTTPANRGILEVLVEIDGARVREKKLIKYEYTNDPYISRINPKRSFISGGRKLSITGNRLDVIRFPRIYAVIDNMRTKSEACQELGNSSIVCLSPKWAIYLSRYARLGFEMDGVLSVTAKNLSIVFWYYPDPLIENFAETKVYEEFGDVLVIKGENITKAATKDDVSVKIACEKCAVSALTDEMIVCQPPTRKPACGNQTDDILLPVEVSIGYFHQRVGYITYEEKVTKPIEETDTITNPSTDTSTDMTTDTSTDMTTDTSTDMTTDTSTDTSKDTNVVVIVLVALISTVMLVTGAIGVYWKRRISREREQHQLALTEIQNRQINENRDTSTAPDLERRRSTGTYAFIADEDLVNVYLELSGEDHEYTKADEYMEPRPYCKIDHPTDKPGIKNDDERGANLAVDENQEGVDELEKGINVDYIHPIGSEEISIPLAIDENQEGVDELEKDIDVDFIHPIGSEEISTNLAVDENQDEVDELEKDIDVDYIHPIGSEEISTNLAVDENQEGVDELEKDIDVNYIHPIGSEKISTNLAVDENHEGVDELEKDIEVDYIHPILSEEMTNMALVESQSSAESEIFSCI